MMRLDKKNERNDDHEFIGDGIEKCTERCALIELAREITVEPVGEAGQRKNYRRRQRAPLPRYVEQHHEHGYKHDAQ